jgi:hypothetical protein
MPSKDVSLAIEQVRAYWAKRQGLSAPVKGGVDEVVRATGWIYSAGSTLPYLAFRARQPGINRTDVDRAVFEEESIVEVPTVRGCTMLVSAEDLSLALMAGRQFSAQYLDKVRKACNVTDREIKDLSAAVPAILKNGPLSMESLRARLPANLVRNFGPSGKSLGERSTLSYSIRLLQRQMIVQRVATDRRLDSEAYAYKLLRSELLRQLTQEEAEDGLARRFFDWAGPATLKEFAWWVGISQRDARIIIARTGLTPVEVAGWAKEAWIAPDRIDELHSARAKKGGGDVTLLPFRDNYLYFRRGIGVLLDDENRKTKVLDWMRRPAVLGELDSLHHNAIVWDGKLVGYWEYDPDEDDVAWRTCSKPSGEVQRKIESRITQLRNFIRSQLGDVAFYPFDSGKNRRERIDSLKG